MEVALRGTREVGKLSGRGILFLLRTTKCIATLNSSKDKAPSLDTSDNCLKKIRQLLNSLIM